MGTGSIWGVNGRGVVLTSQPLLISGIEILVIGPLYVYLSRKTILYEVGVVWAVFRPYFIYMEGLDMI
jgi:hypothetical protein